MTHYNQINGNTSSPILNRRLREQMNPNESVEPNPCGVVGWRLGEATGRKKGLNGIKKMAEEEYGRGETHPRLRVEGAL